MIEVLQNMEYGYGARKLEITNNGVLALAVYLISDVASAVIST